MKLRDILTTNGILIDFKPADKRDALTQMASFMASIYDLKSPEGIAAKIIERESVISTGIGFGIAIPHARIEGIDRLYMIAARTATGVEYDALDEQPVFLVFMMISPTNTASDHSRILSSLSRIMSYEDVRNNLLAAPNAQAFLDTLIEAESKYVE